jgi:uncharacterized protein YlxW (UPF0749 family)
LDALLADAMTPDYTGAERHVRVSTSFLAAALVTAIAGAFLLGTAVRYTSDTRGQTQLTRQALVQRVQAADRRVAGLDVRSHEAQRDLEAAEEAVLSGTSLGAQAQQRLERLRAAAGFSPVTGQGIDLVLDNAPLLGTTDPATDPGRVVDRDLQFAVNGLWQSGATAIAINGIRLTSTSAIRSAGQAILVDYRPLVPPYHVRAIAPNADALAGRFRDSAAGIMLEELETSYGVVWELNSVGLLTLPAATTNGG